MALCASYTPANTNTGARLVVYVVQDTGGAAVKPTASGCANGMPLLENAEYIAYQTVATTQAPPVTITWPDLFNLSPADGATLSVAILAVWVSAWAYRTLRRVLNPDGAKE